MVASLHRVLATSRTPYYNEAAAIGAEFFEDADDFCEEHPDVVILATSILSTEPVLRKLPITRLKRSTLIVDVLSVKVKCSWLAASLIFVQQPPTLNSASATQAYFSNSMPSCTAAMRSGEKAQSLPTTCIVLKKLRLMLP